MEAFGAEGEPRPEEPPEREPAPAPVPEPPPPPPAPPAVAPRVRHEKLDPSYVTAERLGGWIFFLFASAGIGIGLLFLWWVGELATPWRWVLTGAGIGVSLFLAIHAHVWPRIDYAHRSWSLDGESVVVKRGVWWRHVISVPRSRIQHTDVSRGPFERRLGISTLVIHTAGNHDFEIRLPGLSQRTALALRDELLAGANDEV